MAGIFRDEFEFYLSPNLWYRSESHAAYLIISSNRGIQNFELQIQKLHNHLQIFSFEMLETLDIIITSKEVLTKSRKLGLLPPCPH